MAWLQRIISQSPLHARTRPNAQWHAAPMGRWPRGRGMRAFRQWSASRPDVRRCAVPSAERERESTAGVRWKAGRHGDSRHQRRTTLLFSFPSWIQRVCRCRDRRLALTCRHLREVEPAKNVSCPSAVTPWRVEFRRGTRPPLFVQQGTCLLPRVEPPRHGQLTTVSLQPYKYLHLARTIGFNGGARRSLQRHDRQQTCVARDEVPTVGSCLRNNLAVDVDVEQIVIRRVGLKLDVARLDELLGDGLEDLLDTVDATAAVTAKYLGLIVDAGAPPAIASASSVLTYGSVPGIPTTNVLIPAVAIVCSCCTVAASSRHDFGPSGMSWASQ